MNLSKALYVVYISIKRFVWYYNSNFCNFFSICLVHLRRQCEKIIVSFFLINEIHKLCLVRDKIPVNPSKTSKCSAKIIFFPCDLVFADHLAGSVSSSKK